MSDLQSAVAVATKSGKEVMLLLKAIEVVLGQCDAEVRAFGTGEHEQAAGALRRLADDFSRRISAIREFGRVAADLAGSARDSLKAALEEGRLPHANQPCDQQLMVACKLAMQVLASAEQAVHDIEAKMSAAADELQDSALRRDASPQLIATVRELLVRVGGLGKTR